MAHSDRLRSHRRSARLHPRRPDRRAAAGLKKLLLVLAAVSVVLVPASPALAHNQLVSAEPGRDATLRKAPTAVTLAFLQRLDPKSTTVVVSDAEKRQVPSSEPAVKAKTAAVQLEEPLGNGRYTVAYRVVSVDGHTVQGSYAFTVAGPAPSSAAASPSAPAADGPGAAPSPSAAAIPVAVAASSGSGVPTGVLAGLGAAGVVLAAVAVLLYVARRRRAAAQP